MLELVCAGGNKGKLNEFQGAAGEDILIRACGPFDCPETGRTFKANAQQKALCYGRHCETEWLFADDSGLVVDALGGEPGIYSARYAGDPSDDEANNRRVLEKLKGVPTDKRTARFVCVIALVRWGASPALFRGEVEGRILDRPQGKGGFGYDPLFYLPALDRGFADLTPDEKWRVSHRGKAFRRMLEWLRSRGEG